MQELLNGNITLWGIATNPSGSIISTGGSSTSGGDGTLPGNVATGYAMIVASAPLTQQFELDQVRQEQKFTVNLTAADENMECELEFTPDAATKQAIIDALNAANADGSLTLSIFPRPYSKVTLKSFAVRAYNVDWIYI